MRPVPHVALILFSFSSAFAGEIREFSISTLERLGNEISHRDAIAARASDAVLKTQPAARALKARGWITDLHKDGDIVYFITDTSSGPCLSYTATFHGSVKPEVQDRRGQPLPPNIAVRYKALQTATQALKGRLFNIGYNFEVLNDPDGNGFLVYALGATSKPGLFVLGGHFRITISTNGEKVERLDALSRSLLVDDEKNSGLPKGTHEVGMYMNQIVSNKPVETLIYTSNLAKKPIFVGTPDGKVWHVETGKMSLDTSKRGTDSQGAVAHKALGR
jgi:hypothetical protein